MKRELSKALKHAGSGAALARILGVSKSTIYRWKKKGVPQKGEARDSIRAYLRKFDRVKREKALYKRRFCEMRIEATVQGRWPKKQRTRVELHEGGVVVGEVHTLGLNTMMTKATLAKIEKWASKIRGKRPYWQARALTSQYAIPVAGELGDFTDFKGYQSVRSVEQMSMPESGDFGVGLLIATPRSDSKRKALRKILSELAELLQYPPYIAFAHNVELWNYRRRTPEERRAWQTEQRYKRRTELKKRRQRAARKD